ncbi:MAG: TolC family protein [Firmicutes bacterium]|nr:TolC family protein [Bacillota bacterium]
MKKLHRAGTYLMLVMMLLMAFPGVTQASEASAVVSVELTLDEAISKALVHSDTLRQADYDVERSKEVLELVDDKVQNLMTPDTSAGSTPSAAAAANYTTMVSTSVGYESSRITRNIKVDTVKTGVFQNYTGVLNAKEKLTAAEKALDNAQWQQMVAQIGYSVGTVSESSKVLAEANYTGKVAALAAAKANLVDSYQKLNNLIGLNAAERPVLKDDPPLVPLVVDDLEVEIQRRVTMSPSLELAEKNVSLAKMNLDLYIWNNASVPYEAKEIDYFKAEDTAKNSEDQMRQLMRTLYQGIVQLEQQHITTLQTLSSAEENLRIKQVQLDAGMATRGDVISAENDVAGARQALKSLVYQHELYKLYFEKPWTFSSGS